MNSAVFFLALFFFPFFVNSETAEIDENAALNFDRQKKLRNYLDYLRRKQGEKIEDKKSGDHQLIRPFVRYK